VNPWWLGFIMGVALIVVGLVFAARKIASDGGGELSIPHGPTLKAGSTAALALLLGFVAAGWSLQQLGSVSSADTKPKATPAGPGPEQSSGNEPPGQVFADRFAGTRLGAQWQPISGTWRVADGILHGAPTGGGLSENFAWGVLTLDRDLPPAYTLSLRVRLDDADAVAELMIHLRQNRYVRAYLYGIDQDVVLGRGTFLRGGVMPGTLAPEQVQAALGGGESVVQRPFPLRSGIWYRLRVNVQPPRYRIMVSGIEVIDYTDRRQSLSASGGLGLIASRKVAFDDLVVTK
jgi:hypothetical protein